jgi:hypothetical protein
VRAGLQFDRSFSLAYQLAGVHISNGFPLSSSETTWASNALLFEWVSPWPGFVVGAGPAVVIGSATTRCGLLSASCVSQGFVNVGAEVRAAIVLGSYGPTSRQGFTIQSALHAVPEALALTLGIGLDGY